MRFVVTGANGLVGSRLLELLSSRAHAVVGLSRGPSRLVSIKGDFTYLTCELTDGSSVQKALETARPDWIIHTASMTEVDGCEKNVEAAYLANVRATENLAMSARSVGAGLTYVSTDYVFDGDHGPYGEEDIPNPRGVYAVTKHLAEQTVRTLVPNWAIARTAVVYGWPPAGRPNFGSWLVSALAQGQNVKLFEDQFVSPSLADNVAEMLAELGERQLKGIWNTTGASVVDRVTFGRAVCEVFGFDPQLISPVRLKDVQLASPRPLRSGLKTDKAERELSAKPLLLPAALAKFFATWHSEKGERRS